MAETDAILMSLVIFVPTLFALGVILFPTGSDEASKERMKNAMRWWALFGTALTLGLTLCMFIWYYGQVYDRYRLSSTPDRTELAPRAAAAAQEADGKARDAADWVARYPWIKSFNIDYFLGLDGISLPLVLLTSALSFLAMIASWKIDKHVKSYCALFLLLETGMLGTFLALDFFLFYIFWEVMLLPMYFLIGVWGGPRREYAAIKFFLYTLLGSVFILIAMLGFYFTNVRDFVDQRVVRDRATIMAAEQHISLAEAEKKVPVNSFDLVLLQKVGRAAADYIKTDRVPNESLAIAGNNAEEKAAVVDRLKQPFFTKTFQIIMFLLLFVGFAIKVPVFPFHTWLPDAHVEAPTPISMILAGVLLKMGGYGILRIAYPICPWAAEQLAYPVALFGIINIVYGAFAAMAQSDFKKLVAYSSISHMGYVLLGIAVWSAPDKAQYWSWGMNGAMFQMIAHGITSAGMFFLVGVIYDRAHHRRLGNFRGLYEPMPLYGGISAVIFFAAMGLPGLCGFVGEIYVVLATWPFSKAFAVLAALTVVITAAYILWTIQRVFFGPVVNPEYKRFRDMDLREIVTAVPLVVFSVLLGVYPPALMSWMEPSLRNFVDTLSRLGQ